MSKITTNLYFPCTGNILKYIQQRNIVEIPKCYYLNMAKELISYYEEDYNRFLLSTNGQLLLSDEGINGCYNNYWIGSITKITSMVSIVNTMYDNGEDIYKRIKRYIARMKTIRLDALPREPNIFQNYIHNNDKHIAYILTVDVSKDEVKDIYNSKHIIPYSQVKQIIRFDTTFQERTSIINKYDPIDPDEVFNNL